MKLFIALSSVDIFSKGESGLGLNFLSPDSPSAAVRFDRSASECPLGGPGSLRVFAAPAGSAAAHAVASATSACRWRALAWRSAARCCRRRSAVRRRVPLGAAPLPAACCRLLPPVLAGGGRCPEHSVLFASASPSAGVRARAGRSQRPAVLQRPRSTAAFRRSSHRCFEPFALLVFGLAVFSGSVLAQASAPPRSSVVARPPRSGHFYSCGCFAARHAAHPRSVDGCCRSFLLLAVVLGTSSWRSSSSRSCPLSWTVSSSAFRLEPVGVLCVFQQ